MCLMDSFIAVSACIYTACVCGARPCVYSCSFHPLGTGLVWSEQFTGRWPKKREKLWRYRGQKNCALCPSVNTVYNCKRNAKWIKRLATRRVTVFKLFKQCGLNTVSLILWYEENKYQLSTTKRSKSLQFTCKTHDLKARGHTYTVW